MSGLGDANDAPRATSRGILTWIVGFGGLASILALVLYAQMQRVELDPAGCPVGQAPTALTVLIVDQSDPFERADRDMIGEVVAGWLAKAAKFDRLVLVVPRSSDPFETDIRFDGCAPQNPDTANRILATRSRLIEPWTRYTHALDEQVKLVMSQRNATTTPLIETVVAAAREPAFRSARTRQLIIISDLMQNSKAANFYKSIPSLTQLEASDLGKTAYLQGVIVDIRHAARRQGAAAKPEVLAFWKTWLKAQGAKVDAVVE